MIVRNFWPHLLTVVLFLLCLWPVSVYASDHPETENQKLKQTAFFESKIRPVLASQCYSCHSTKSGKARGGLRLDDREAMLKGGDSGPAVVPGRPEESYLLEAISYESLEMPPDGRLSDNIISDFRKWISDGAADPRVPAEITKSGSDPNNWTETLKNRSKWWSLQPPKPVNLPDSDQSHPVDRFISEALAKKELKLGPAADEQVLFRRLSFVLTGLPPKPAQLLKFLEECKSSRSNALENAINQFLESPHFGERFARHWMDVVRYTDTYGYEWDIPAKGSWEYRDYLIRAFNQDVGFDQLIREQVSGDLMDQPRINLQEGVNESLIGPMFYHMGEHRHGSSIEFNGIHQEMIDNKIDAFSKAFLGMTVACARCHDHKLDAVSQKDYYALAAVFMTPRWTTRVIDTPDRNLRQILELRKLRSEIRNRLASDWLNHAEPLRSGEALKSWALRNSDQIKAQSFDDISYPLFHLVLKTAESRRKEKVESEIKAMTWRQLKEAWKAENANRSVTDQNGLQVLADFSTPSLPQDWSIEGDGFRYGYVNEATPLIALEGPLLVKAFLPQGYHTHALSSKLPGALRPPPPDQFPLPRLSLELCGGEWAGWREIPQNAFLNEGPSFFDAKSQARWITVSAKPHVNGVTRILTEFSTSSLNANFPPRTGVANAGGVRLPDRDEGHNKRSWLSLTGIVAHNGANSPRLNRDFYQDLFDSNQFDDSEPTIEQSWQALADWLTGTIQRWAQGNSRVGDSQILQWLLEKNLLPNSAEALPEVARLVKKYRAVEAQIGFPRTVNGMDETGLQAMNYHLNIRGDVHREGPAIARDFLEVFQNRHSVAASAGSGRLELADFLTDQNHPLTARVYVNRVWGWIFGEGLVRTPNDFGLLGDQPSHPDLLDWLAEEFRNSGWSTKSLIRLLVTSRTFQQSGHRDAIAMTADPTNRLWHHFPTRRLEAEALRDSLLCVSGSLDQQLYGLPINPHRSVEDTQKRLFSGPLDGHGRRSVYLEMSIMEPPRFLVGFNLPDLKLPTGRRDKTSVPAQALILLNDPLVRKLADDWAKRLINDQSLTVQERLQDMFLSALGREPSSQEIRRWSAAVSEFATGPDILRCQRAWAEIAHCFFNLKEFLYYR